MCVGPSGDQADLQGRSVGVPETGDWRQLRTINTRDADRTSSGCRAYTVL